MDLTPYHFNPAGRLYELLAYCHTKANVSTHRVWSDYMGLDPESSLFYAGIAGIQALPAQARAAFDALPADVLLLADADGAHEALTRAEAALRDGARDLTANISQVTQRYNEGDLVHIKQCGKFLEGGLVRATPTESDVASLTTSLEDIAGLANEIIELLETADDLPTQVRVALFEQADAFRRAVALARIEGPEAVLRERDRLTGLVVTNPAVREGLRSNPTIRAKFVQIVTSANFSFGLINAAAISGGHFANLIQGLTAVLSGDANGFAMLLPQEPVPALPPAESTS